MVWVVVIESWIVEDDYDSEFCFVGCLILVMVGFDGLNCMIYVGSFFKIFFLGLRLGYVILLLDLRDCFVEIFRWFGSKVSVMF